MTLSFTVRSVSLTCRGGASSSMPHIVKLAFIVALSVLSVPGQVAAQWRAEALGHFEGGGVQGAGAVAALGGSAALRFQRVEFRAGSSRFGIATGCDGFCDLHDARVIEVGAGFAFGDHLPERAWTAGATIARVRERHDTPRPMAALYLRRPWTLASALVAATELRAHALPIRGHGTGVGWALRLGLGAAAGSSRTREP